MQYQQKSQPSSGKLLTCFSRQGWSLGELNKGREGLETRWGNRESSTRVLILNFEDVNVSLEYMNIKCFHMLLIEFDNKEGTFLFHLLGIYFKNTSIFKLYVITLNTFFLTPFHSHNLHLPLPKFIIFFFFMLIHPF